MPYVNIKITREGATREQKAELIRVDGRWQIIAKVLHFEIEAASAISPASAATRSTRQRGRA